MMVIIASAESIALASSSSSSLKTESLQKRDSSSSSSSDNTNEDDGEIKGLTGYYVFIAIGLAAIFIGLVYLFLSIYKKVKATKQAKLDLEAADKKSKLSKEILEQQQHNNNSNSKSDTLNSTITKKIPTLSLKNLNLSSKPKLFTVDGGITISQALSKMAINNYVSLPIHDQQDKTMIINIVSVFDLLSHVTRATDTFKALEQPIELVLVDIDPKNLNLDTSNESLLKFATGLKRGLIKSKDDQTGASTISLSNVHTHTMVTQSDIIKHFLLDIEKSACDLNSTLKELGFTTRGEIVTMPDTMSAMEGYTLMRINNVLALPILKNGRFCGNLSASDLRGLQLENIDKLELQVNEYLQVLPHFKFSKPVGVSPDITIKQAVEKIVEHHVHRLWIVDEGEKVVGVITLTHMIKLLSGI